MKLLNIGRDQKPVDSPYDQSYNPPALAANLKSFYLKLPFSQPRPLSLQTTAKIKSTKDQQFMHRGPIVLFSSHYFVACANLKHPRWISHWTTGKSL